MMVLANVRRGVLDLRGVERVLAFDGFRASVFAVDVLDRSEPVCHCIYYFVEGMSYWVTGVKRLLGVNLTL